MLRLYQGMCCDHLLNRYKELWKEVWGIIPQFLFCIQNQSFWSSYHQSDRINHFHYLDAQFLPISTVLV